VKQHHLPNTQFVEKNNKTSTRCAVVQVQTRETLDDVFRMQTEKKILSFQDLHL